MAKTITALFSQRREAEMAVERLVQEHGVARDAVRILSASDANTAGTEVAGADTDGDRPKTGTEGEPALRGEIRVSADVEDAQVEAVKSAFASYGGRQSGA